MDLRVFDFDRYCQLQHHCNHFYPNGQISIIEQHLAVIEAWKCSLYSGRRRALLKNLIATEEKRTDIEGKKRSSCKG